MKQANKEFKSQIKAVLVDTHLPFEQATAKLREIKKINVPLFLGSTKKSALKKEWDNWYKRNREQIYNKIIGWKTKKTKNGFKVI